MKRTRKPTFHQTTSTQRDWKESWRMDREGKRTFLTIFSPGMTQTLLREGEDALIRIHVVRDIVEVRVTLAIVIHVEHDRVLVATVGINPDLLPMCATIIHTTTRCRSFGLNMLWSSYPHELLHQ